VNGTVQGFESDQVQLLENQTSAPQIAEWTPLGRPLTPPNTTEISLVTRITRVFSRTCRSIRGLLAEAWDY